jgi:myosin heavy chain 6/7
VNEWRLKCDDLSNELDSSQRDCRNCSSELFRLRAAWDETVEQLDSVRRENKNLADEIKDLLDQLGEGGRSIHELDKQRRRLQVRIIRDNKLLIACKVHLDDNLGGKG